MKKGKKVFLGVLGTVMTVSLLTGLFIRPTLAVAEKGKKYHFYVVMCGTAVTDPFWLRVEKGVNEAAEAFGVKATYLGPAEFSVKETVDLINRAIAAKPDGLACMIISPTALDKPLRAAIKRGIPVIAVNVRDFRPPEKRIPYLGYVGEDSRLTGVSLAKRVLMEFTPKRAVIGIHQPGNIVQEVRSQGIIDVLSEKGIPVEKLDITPTPTVGIGILKSYVKKHPETDVIFTLGPPGTRATVTFLKEEGLVGKIKHGTIDLDPLTIDAIKKGITICAVEQQQYLQGFLSVMWLYLYNKYGFTPPEVTATGPAIVDKSNVKMVEEMVEKGYR